ncbi:hypothetical protein [Glycomyces sp. YM15]|uniref:hypothetical protein n=1 Tax=Glycomyces sp. YM15 TaxID=2800446 RepID=UPI001962A0CC|nr:hypothetical protein [Glycomyces sp. YM15]
MLTRRFAPFIALALLTAAACGEGTRPEAADPTPPLDEIEQLDQLWADVASAQLELRVAETEAVIECLAGEGFTAHNVEAMTSGWNMQGPSPSATLASIEGPVGLPDTAEAATRALGHWLDFADAYGDQDGIDLQETELAAASDADETEMTAVNVPELEAAGEGWEGLPAVEQMRWEIAYRGVDWAVTSKTASILNADDWEAAGMPGGEWAPAGTVKRPPEGCQGATLTELHGEPREVDDVFTGSRWVWGPVLELGESSAPFTVDPAPEADEFLTCLADAGYGDWTLSQSGGLDMYDHWQQQYLPEAAQQTSDGVTEYSHSDITDADRERYETAKAAEFEAAAAVTACDEAVGYTAAASAQWEQAVVESIMNTAPAQRAYLEELEAALADVGE